MSRSDEPVLHAAEAVAVDPHDGARMIAVGRLPSVVEPFRRDEQLRAVRVRLDGDAARSIADHARLPRRS